MKITEVRLFKLFGEGRTKGYASITLDECFVVNGLKIIKGNKGLFVSMPKKLDRKHNKQWDIVSPANKETGEMVNNEVLKKYMEK